MKKLAFLVIAIALVSFGANAQSTFDKSTKTIKLGLGFNSNGKPITLAFEKGIQNDLFGVEKLNLGVGAYAGLYSYSTTVNYGIEMTTSTLVIAPGVTGTLHYQFIDKLDTYAGLSLGAVISSVSVESSVASASSSATNFAWGLAGGLRYEITPKWGAYIEGGKGTGSVTIGVAMKF